MTSYESGYDPKLGYNKNAFDQDNSPVQLKILGKTVKLLAGGIGLVSEAIHNRKGGKAAAADQEGSDAAVREESEIDDGVYVNLSPEQADALIKSGDAVAADDKKPTHELVPENDLETDGEEDEAAWSLDDAATIVEEGSSLKAMEKLGFGQVQTDAKKTSQKAAKLPFPVVIPQRRPKTKSRGFVRAYAPVLEDVGIERDQFLGFIEDLHTHAQASPIFKVIRFGNRIAGLFPEPSIIAATIAVSIVNEVASEMNQRWRANKFLEEANREMFAPQGLYALIVTWAPGGDPEAIEAETIDLGSEGAINFPSSLPAETDTSKTPLDQIKSKAERLRVSSATTSETQMPLMCAELVFPALDATQAAAENKNGQVQRGIIDGVMSTSKSSAKFVGEYFDRRAQASYASSNPNATLTKQASPVAPQFKSRYADPNDHTNKHFFTLITGGRYKAEPLGAKRRWERGQRQAAARRAQGLKERPKKRRLGENVLYLAIVNKPSDAEIEAAKQKLSIKKAQ